MSVSINKAFNKKGLLLAIPIILISCLTTENTSYPSFREVADKVLPVVVSIDVTDVVTQDTPWEYFFGDPEDEEDTPSPHDFERFGMGSGVIIEKRADKYYVLTNYHVVKGATSITIILFDKRKFKAQVVGEDARRDLSLIVFESKDDLPVAILGDSDDLQVGDWVLAVGSPFGWQSSVTVGIVSALGRRLDYNSALSNISDFIQTDAGINPGNSGGALINTEGEVIGINTWITSPTGGSIGIGFAIPINNAKKTINDFLTKGKVQYGWLGISVTNLLVAEIAQELDLVAKKGAFVNYVIKDSPAAKGGLFPGDFITKINGIPIEDDRHLTQVVGDLVAGVPVEFELIRLKNYINLTIILDVRPAESAVAAQTKNLWPGFLAIPLSKEVRKEYNIPDTEQGVLVIVVERNTAAFEAGLQSGDIIKEINGRGIKNILDFYRELNNKDYKELEIFIIRSGSEDILILSR